jgi:hypothetical protein
MVINRRNKKAIGVALHVDAAIVGEMIKIVECSTTKSIRLANPERYGLVTAWKSGECYHAASLDEVKMRMFNVLIEGYGVEALHDGYWFPYPDYSYVNLGDSYAATVIYDRRLDKYKVQDWGSIAEKFKGVV